MNPGHARRTPLVWLAAMPLALLVVGAAAAQAAPPPLQTGETPPGQMQPRSSTSAPMRPMPDSSPAARATHMQNQIRKQPGSFAALAGSKGYITQGGAASDAWLDQHFAQCDTNHDGRITRKEYERCRRQNPPQP